MANSKVSKKFIGGVVLMGFLIGYLTLSENGSTNSSQNIESQSTQRVTTFADAKKDSSLIDAGRCFKYSETDSYSYCLPSLICIGAMKAGTFELKQWLSIHELVSPSKNELHFFGNGIKRSKYKTMVSYVSGPVEWKLPDENIIKGGITFEKTPFYISSSLAAQELHSLLPSVQLVALLRDPVARAYSAFMHHCDRKKRMIIDQEGLVVFNSDCATEAHCCCSPVDAPKVTKKILSQCTPNTFQDYLDNTETDLTSPQLGTILRKGLYAKQLKLYLSLFDRQQLLVMDLKSFSTDPSACVNKVFDFVGLSSVDFSGLTMKNKAGYTQLKGMASKSGTQKPYPPMLPATRSSLETLYADADQELASLFPGVPFSWIAKK